MVLFYSGFHLVFLELLQSSTDILSSEIKVLSGYLACWDCTKDLDT